MWVFANNSFISIVEHYDQIKYKDVMVVRARRENDLDILFLSHKILETSDSDYRFRVFVPRYEVKGVVASLIDDIDYDNFKNSIPDEEHERHSAYLRVWFEMQKFQQKSHNSVAKTKKVIYNGI